jgi:sigma-B regulation protein RsbU (phosphoserine phosphatase)
MVALSGSRLARVRSSHPKEMYEAYAIRAALEEIGGRAASGLLKGNTAVQQRALDSMRVAVRNHDLDAYAEHDVIFHRSILEASKNDVVLRVWDSLAFDVRIRAAIGKVIRDLPELVESRQPIVDALTRGQGKQAGLLLRNHVETLLQLLKKAEMDSLFFEQDLEIAREVQQAFIPQEAPSIPGLICETLYRPAHSIGGDYYDFFPLRSELWGIAIGDVSGKGIGAALIMASLQASVRAQARQPHSGPSALIDHVNRLVYKSSPAHFYASLFYAEYDPATQVLTYVNAGQNPPFVIRGQNDRSRVFRLQNGGVPVGLFEDPPYNSALFRLEHGDILVACTDGIIEAENRDGELWGERRLENLLCCCGPQTPRQVLDCIVNEISVFVDGAPQGDDITLLVMQVRAV